MLKQISFLYSSSKRSVQLKHVHSEELSQLAKTLDQFRGVHENRYRDDRYVQDTFAMLRGIFYKLCSSLLPFNEVIDQDRQNEIRLKLAQMKTLYPELFTSAIVPVAKALKQIFETHRNDLNDELCRLIENHCHTELALVSKRASSSQEQKALSNNLKYAYDITYYTETGFRNSLNFYRDVFYIGTPAYFGSWATDCLRGDTTFFISYDIFTSKVESRSVFPKQLPKGLLQSTVGKHVQYSDALEKSLAIDVEHLQYSAKEAVQRILADQAGESSNMQSVEASIVHLENERFIFVSKDSKIRTFTPNTSKDFVKQIPFQDLEEDTFIIVRNERDSRLIAEVADQEVLKADAPRLRAMQEEWKLRLNKLVDKKGITRASLYLSNSHGMTTASTASIRTWCGEDSICPQELPLLLHALGYTRDEIEEVHTSMRRIQTAHISAGRHISQKLMSELTADISGELLEKGWYTFTSRYLNGASFNIERVVAIDHSKHSVMPYNLMKLFGLTD